MSEDLHPILKEKNITPGTPEAVLAVAGFYVAMKYEEGPRKDNLFGKWYGANHGPWCAEFVSYCFNKGGAGYVVNKLQSPKGYISCTAGIKAMKKRGYKQVTAAEAQPGDIIFFDWNHDHDVDHTGIVLKNNPKKKIVTCREGNTSRAAGSKSNGGQCAQRDRNYSNVFAVFRPNWKTSTPVESAPVVAETLVEQKEPIKQPEAAQQVTQASAQPVKISNPGYPGKLIKPGSKEPFIKYMQQQLHVPITGIFDSVTKAAVISLQKRNKLTADGIVGPKTWAALK